MSGCASGRAVDFYTAGLEDYNRKMYENALSEFRQAIKSDPDFAEAYFYLASAYFQKNMPAQAIWACNQAIQVKPGYAEPYGLLAYYCNYMGNQNETLKIIEKAADLMISDMEFGRRIIRAFDNISLGRQVVGLLERKIKSGENRAGAYYALSYASALNQDYDTAILAGQKALALAPGMFYARFNLAFAFSRKGRIDEAIEKYLEVLAEKPDYSVAHNNLAVLYERQKKFDLAEKEYLGAVAANREFGTAYAHLGLMYYGQGKSDAALKCLRDATAFEPDDPSNHFYLGIILLAFNRNDDAVQEFEKAIDLKEDYSDAYMELGKTFAGMRLFDRAIYAYKKTLEIGLGVKLSTDNMDIAADIERACNKAIAEYEKMLQRNPDFALASYNLSALYLKVGNKSQAIAALKQAVNLDSRFLEKAKSDADFDAVREDADFKAILERTP